jgi:hypothetical protein
MNEVNKSENHKSVRSRFDCVIRFLCPKVKEGYIPPILFSRTCENTLAFQLPLPFRWRDYSFMRKGKVWGTATLLYINKRIFIRWIEDFNAEFAEEKK